MNLFLIPSAFLAGFLMFFAPCTLPLVPGYLGFVSGVSRRQIIKNAVFFILGFTAIFILFGSIFTIVGLNLAGFRPILTKIGGIFIIFFGLMLTGILRWSLLQFSWHPRLPQGLKPGTPFSSLVFGAAFAFGWTPCVGPILGTILLLASSGSSVIQGMGLLAIFSLGLAVPFLLVAAGMKSLIDRGKQSQKLIRIIEVTGGLILILIGSLLTANKFGLLVSTGFRLLNFVNYDRLLDYL